MKDLAETMTNNVFLENARVPRFCGKADKESIPASAIPKFTKFMENRGQSFLEEIDNWLTEHTGDGLTETTERVRIGVGLFAIEDKNPMEKSR